MEITDFYSENDVPKGFTGICRHPLGTLVYYEGGKVHRKNGPAIIYHDGGKGWYWQGRISTKEEIFEKLSDEEKEEVIWNMDEWK